MTPVKAGDRVIVLARHDGVVRHRFEDGSSMLGLEMRKPVGDSDGVKDGHRYFSCRPGHGILVFEKAVEPYSPQLYAVYVIQRAVRLFLARKRLRAEMLAHTWNMLDNHEEQLLLKRGAQLREAERVLSPMAQKKTPKARSKSLEDFVEPEYEGPHLKWPITLDQVLEILEGFKKGLVLHYKYSNEILNESRKVLLKQNTLQEVNVKDSQKITIVGDLHGQLQDLFSIFTINGLPSPENKYLFNGDFVDRGRDGCEVFLTICMFMLVYPAAVYINRGNHESRSQNSWMGFEEEVLYKYDGAVFQDPLRAHRILESFQSCFDALPLCAVVQSKIFVVHGGLFARDGVTLSHLRAVQRKREPPLHNPSFEDQVFEDMLWSDPRPILGRQPSERGAGVEFGQDVTNHFCAVNGIALIVRSHECVQEGFEVLHGGRLITLFSASRYCGTQNNKGAFLSLGEDLQPEIQQFYAHTMQQTDFGLSPNKLEAKLENDNIRMIVERICDSKPSLYWYFTKNDEAKLGMVSRLVWAEGLKSVLKLDLPYLTYQSRLAELEGNGMINYTKFLERYQIELSVDNTEWQNAVVEKICLKLFKALGAGNVEQAFKVFDADANGEIEYEEFVNTLKKMDIGLTDQQIYELMRSADTNEDSKIDFREFAGRFEVIFTNVAEVEEEQASLMQVEEEEEAAQPRYSERRRSLSSPRLPIPASHVDIETQKLLQQIGAAIFRQEDDLAAAFRKFDSNEDGVLSYDEFAVAVVNMGLGITKERAKVIAEKTDEDRNGYIEYNEFINAFKIRDRKFSGGLGEIGSPLSGGGGTPRFSAGSESEAGAAAGALSPRAEGDMVDQVPWQHRVLQQVSNVLFQHRIHMRAAFRMFDVDNSGFISMDEFREGLSTVNRLLHEPISNDQIEELMKSMDKNQDGQLSYKEFLEGFRVVDTHRLVDLEETGPQRPAMVRRRSSDRGRMSGIPETGEGVNTTTTNRHQSKGTGSHSPRHVGATEEESKSQSSGSSKGAGRDSMDITR